MQKVPISTIHLFPLLEQRLVELLHSLSMEEWNAPTIAGEWTVKDVAAHLLDGSTRTISSLRDGHANKLFMPLNTFEELVAYLNRLNADWVLAMKRVSPQVLALCIEVSAKQYIEELKKKNLFEPSVFSVAWAGESTSLNWFHIAREYTERWHHQQQVRDAVNKPGIMTKELYYPVLDTFMMALPHTYRNTYAKKNTVLKLSIDGEAGGDWFLTKKDNWELAKENDLPVAAHISIDGAVAWKLFTKSWRRKDVLHHIAIEGEVTLAEVALNMVSVMA